MDRQLVNNVFRFEGVGGCFFGVDVVEFDDESRSPASRRREAIKTINKTIRACNPRFLTLVMISLLLDDLEGRSEVDATADLEEDEGAYALKDARMWLGVMEGAGLFKGLSSSSRADVDAETARSMAPRRTSKRLLTSPVRPATFLVKSMSVGAGINFLTSHSG